jgi:hypothetical protein
VVNEVTFQQGFFRVFRVSLPITTAPLLHTHLSPPHSVIGFATAHDKQHIIMGSEEGVLPLTRHMHPASAVADTDFNIKVV